MVPQTPWEISPSKPDTPFFNRLRDYQREAFCAVMQEFDAGKPQALVWAVMGAGKTEVSFALMEAHKSALFLVNRIDLVEQSARRYGPGCGVYCASLGQKTVRRVTFASPQSVQELEDLPKFDLVVIDEAHRAAHGDFRKLVEKLRDGGSRILGLSATPWPVLGEGKLFPRATFEFGIKRAIDSGFLVKPKLRASQHAFDARSLSIEAGDFAKKDLNGLTSQDALISEQVKETLALTKDRKCVVLATINIDHAEKVARLIAERGETVVAFHSKLTMLEREERMRRFKSGEAKYMSFVTIVSEGFDEPKIDTVVFYRPTRSAVLAVQTAGRGLRLSPGKQDCHVIDYGGVFEALGPIDAPRLPKGKERKGDAYKDPPYKFCPKCFAYTEQKSKDCPECGLHFTAPKKAERDVTKSLDRRARDGTLLSGERKLIQRPCTAVRLSFYRAKSGRNTICITYERGLMETLAKEYCALPSSKSEFWLMGKARDKLKRLRMDKSVEWVLANPQSVVAVKVQAPTAITIETGSTYPEVREIFYELDDDREEEANAYAAPQVFGEARA